ncbi:MAG: esterase [Bacteroidaceae bacterium]|nr:esterase [Bacteroidaceae bacterium]
MKKNFRLMAVAVALLTCFTANAQEMNSLMFRAGVKSPELKNDSVTFRFVAPKARTVAVSASWLGYDPSKLPMTQDQTGVWSVSVPQPSPELYTYNIVVDGVTMLDPSNVFVQRDGSRYMNAFLVRGDFADLYAESSKAGDVEHVWYYSAENDMMRRMYVYTPAGYDPSNKSVKYPVLYLLHGGGGDEDAWSTLGRTCQILDNLIAAGKAKPMIVVMPNGNPNQYAAQTLGIPVKENVKKYNSNFDNYSSLVADILPYVEKNYNVIKNRKGRAVAGLSMGGGQSFFIAFRNVDVFANVGIFSSGLIGSAAIGGAPFDAEALFPGMYSAPQKFNRFDVIYLACGEQDNRIDGMLDFKKKLDANGYKGVVWEQYPGAHEWKVWRRNLTSFVQLIFK